MQRVFFPGRVDYEGSMARAFNSARAVSSHSQAVWREALEPYIRRADVILDLGSGTGRFAVLLADWFGATVIGVEPAAGMREVAAMSGRHAGVFYAAGRAEQLPFRELSLTAALLSNVYHHVADRRSCAVELQRVLRPDGCVLIRGVFAGRLGKITQFDHFPEAKAVCERFPTLDETVQTFTKAGFKFETIEPIVQQTCSGLKELAARTRLRADTTLALMTDEQFNDRQAALEAAAARETEPAPVVETLDLLVLRRRAN